MARRMVLRQFGFLALLALAGFGAAAPARAATCIEVGDPHETTFRGHLSYIIFPGPPGYEDIRKGAEPEPAYILTLDRTMCVNADGDPQLAMVNLDRIHVWFDRQLAPSRDAYRALHRFIGARVVITGRSGFGEHTGHHRAPMVLTVVGVTADLSPGGDDTAGRSTVESFYRALERGDGSAATALVEPSKRQAGPLSAPEISRFYGSLAEPLRLLDLVAEGPGTWRVRYAFGTTESRCDGTALVQTGSANGLHLIESIRSISGC